MLSSAKLMRERHRQIRMQTHHQEEARCAFCHQALDQGHDLLGVQQGVLGNRGFVPVDVRLLFCCDGCVAKYFDMGADEPEFNPEPQQ